METRTIHSIVYEKYLDTLERTSFEKILDMSVRIGAGIIISVVLVKASAIKEILLANDAAVLKSISGMIVGWHSRRILELGRQVIQTIRTERADPEEGPEEDQVLLEGVSIEKITEFIFETKGWKRSGAEKIGLGRAAIDRIGKGLEKVGAFVRGEANARILREGYEREGILTVLTNAATIGEYTATPTAPLSAPVEEENSEASGFVRTAL